MGLFGGSRGRGQETEGLESTVENGLAVARFGLNTRRDWSLNEIRFPRCTNPRSQVPLSVTWAVGPTHQVGTSSHTIAALPLSWPSRMDDHDSRDRRGRGGGREGVRLEGRRRTGSSEVEGFRLNAAAPVSAVRRRTAAVPAMVSTQVRLRASKLEARNLTWSRLQRWRRAALPTATQRQQREVHR